MDLRFGAAIAAIALALAGAASAASPINAMADILAASKPAEWRTIDPENTLYLDMPSGRVIIELAPAFAPHHVANIKALVRAGYFDNAAIVRAQDDYVVQWSQPNEKQPLGAGRRNLQPEFDRPLVPAASFSPLPDRDAYAAKAGFVDGFPAAGDPAIGRSWLVHCYGMVGAGRDTAADSGDGSELYAVIGHAPRQLDRNVTLVGRVVRGIELLSVLPRGTAEMGFYKTPAERTPIRRIVIAADLPAAERVPLEALRTDSASFRALVESRRNRREPWFKVPAGRIDVCNTPLPVRVQAH